MIDARTSFQGSDILLTSAFLSTAAASPHVAGRSSPALTKAWSDHMLILIGVLLVVAAFVVTVVASAGRRSGLLELGSVSTQWLAEHREYQEGGRSR